MQHNKILAEPIFVGRDQELEHLTQSLEHAIAGKGSTIFVSGEAGSGKTRLIAEFLKIAKNKIVTILYGWCLSNATIPYFPFVEAFDSYISMNEDDGASVNQKFVSKSWLLSTNQSELTENLVNMQPQLWKDRTFHVVAKELLLLSEKKPLILIIEDIHWADSASLALLHYLARQVGCERILVLATFRTEELGVDSKGQPNKLSRALLLMGRDDLFKEIKLPKLGLDDVERIAESMLNGKVYPEFVKRLTSDSGGIPLFIVEFLRMLNQQKSLSKKNGLWRSCADDLEIPQKVRDVIMRRLNALTLDQRKILDIASVVGEKFDPKLVAAVISCDYAELLMTLNEIAKNTLMVRCEENGYRFEHVKFREMLYQELPSLLKNEYHLLIAEKLESVYQYSPKASVSDLAYHFVHARNKNKAIRYSLQAGKVALSRFSNQEAIEHFSYVINTISKNREFKSERLSALEGTGDALLASNMFKESMKVYEELAETTENGVVKLRALRKAMDSAFQLGDISHLVDLIEKAEPYASADRLEQARILVSRGRAFHLRSMLSAATRQMEQALEVFEEEYSLRDVAWSLIGLGVYHSGASMPQEGVAESLRSIAIFQELGDLRWQLEAYWVAGMALNFSFVEKEALKMFAKVSEIDKRENIGDYQQLVYAHAFSSRSYESMGDFEKALACSLKALELSEKTDSPLAKGVVYSDLARQYARLGMKIQAEKYFKKLGQIPSEILADPRIIAALAKAVLAASNSKWKQSNHCFITILEKSDPFDVPEFILGIVRSYYAWALKKQGRLNNAKIILEENRKKRQELEDQLKNLNVRANFMAPTRVKVNQKFEARLDIVNVSRQLCYLSSIKNLINPKLEITSIHPTYITHNESINLGRDVLNPFQIKTITVSFLPKHPGGITLNPRVIYSDESGKKMIVNTKNIQIAIQPIISTKIEQIEFKSDYSKRAFDFLIMAFLADTVQLKLSLDKSGWRTLMNIVKNGKVSKHSMYGRSGRGGRVILELEQLGLVESRLFLGERGRGGRVLKLRICPEKENVKQFLDQRRGKK